MSDRRMEQMDLDDAFLSALVDDDPQDLYENAPCGFVSSGVDGTIVKVNATFLAWTGYTRSDLVGGRRFQELFAPGDQIFFETHVAPMLRLQGLGRELALDLVVPSGERLPVLVNVVLVRDDAGRPARMRAVLFDARERRAYDRELFAARRRAEESEARARTLARTLQASLLPLALSPVPGFDVGAAYRPGGDGSVVGGDFYDVFETGRGTWAVVLGDVCGKGPEAAVVAALARYTMRAEASRFSYPSAVLCALHAAMTRSHPGRFCTALFAILDPTSGMLPGLLLASGGHHLPVRRRADGAFERPGRLGTLLGMVPTPVVHDSDVALARDDTLVLVTDGVLEARRGGTFFSEDRLGAVIEGSAEGSATAIAEEIVAAALDFQRGHARDDMAVVVIRAADGSGGTAFDRAEGSANPDRAQPFSSGN